MSSHRHWSSRSLAAAMCAALAVGGLPATGWGQSAEPASSARHEVSDGALEWGVRTSYRSYITGPIAHGEITAADGATWLDGPGNARGPFRFPDAVGSIDPQSGTGELTFAGSVYTGGHDYGDGPVLELSLHNVRLRFDGDEAIVVVDARYRPFAGANPNVAPPEMEIVDDLAFARVDLSDADLTPTGEGVVTVSDAPVTGVPETMEAIGWDQFYSAEMPSIQLDPLSFSAVVETATAPTVTQHPADVIVGADENAVFTAQADGDPAPDVHWEKQKGDADWSAVDGATGETLTVAGVTPDDDGARFRAVFTNDAGRAVTDSATLTVTIDETPEPSLQVYAADGTTPLGDTPVAAGEEIVVRGSGFDPEANTSTRPPVPPGLPAGVYVVFGKFDQTWRPSEDAGSGARRVIDQRWAMTEATLEQIPGQYQGAVLDQWVELTPDGKFEATLTVDTQDGDGTYGVYTYAAGGAAPNPHHELAVTVTVDKEAEEPPAPAIEVSKTVGLDPYADVVTVRGSGFEPDHLDDGLRVGIGMPTDDGSVPDLEPELLLLPGEDADEISADGTFEVDLYTSDIAPGSVLAVHTAPVDSAAPGEYVTSTEIAFAGERTPALTVEPTEDLEVGDVVTVTGTGFAPNRKISIAVTANASTHETYGWPTGWLAHGVVQADDDGELHRSFTVPQTVTGSGEDCADVQCYVASFSSAQADDATPVDHRADRSQDVLVPVTFATGRDEPEPQDPEFTITPSRVRQGEQVTFRGDHLTPGATADVIVAADPDATAGDATMDWGVRESFRNYIEGSIAQGSIEVDPPASRNDDGAFRFAEGHGRADARSADITFGGEVHFTGHDHGTGPLLRFTLRDPRIVVDGETGVLIADVTSKSLDSGEAVEYPDVEFAELDLSEQKLTDSGGAIFATDVPATLTEDGAPAFADFYEPGTPLDPISFSATVTGETEFQVGSATVNDDGSATLTWTVPTTLPVGTATATLTSGEVRLTREFAVAPVERSRDDGGDESGNDSGDGDAAGGADGGDESGTERAPGGDDAGTDTGTSNGADAKLPDTGASAPWLLVTAFVLLVVGGIVALTSARRASKSTL